MATQKSKASIEVTILVLSLWVLLNGCTPGTLHAADRTEPECSSDRARTQPQFCRPTSVAVDSLGNVYVADQANHRIRKIDADGQVSTLAGSGEWGGANGPGAMAQFRNPTGVAVDASGNVYVADKHSMKIRIIDPAGNVSALAGSMYGFADGAGARAKFGFPTRLAVDVSGNVFVADTGNHAIRKIDAARHVSTLAGNNKPGFADGPGATAQFTGPYGVAVDRSGNVYVADTLNHLIRKIDTAGNVTTLAGSEAGFADGQGTSAQFDWPSSVAVDSSGNVYVADTLNNRIRKIDAAGNVTTLAGSEAGFADGQGALAQFDWPNGVAVDADGNVYVADHANNRIRKINVTGNVSTLAGDGPTGISAGEEAPRKGVFPNGLAVDASGNLVASTAEFRFRKLDKYASPESRGGDSELAQLADSFAETEPPDGSPGYAEVVETFLDFAVAQDLDNMVEMVSPSGLNEHGIDTVKEYYANDVVPFFSDFVKLHNVSGIAAAWDEYGHKGRTHYLYSVTKSGAEKPFAIQLLIEDGKVVVGKVIVGECFRPHHPFC